MMHPPSRLGCIRSLKKKTVLRHQDGLFWGWRLLFRNFRSTHRTLLNAQGTVPSPGRLPDPFRATPDAVLPILALCVTSKTDNQCHYVIGLSRFADLIPPSKSTTPCSRIDAPGCFHFPKNVTFISFGLWHIHCVENRMS